MKTSQNGLRFIMNEESFKSRPYLDAVGVPTIGYGTTVYENGNKVTLNDPAISQTRATQLLINMLDGYEKAVLKAVKHHLNQNQFDALVSFAYNVGKAGMAGSTVVKLINTDLNHPDIPYWFSVWNKGTIKGKKVVLNGLVARRKRESDLYFKK